MEETVTRRQTNIEFASDDRQIARTCQFNSANPNPPRSPSRGNVWACATAISPFSLSKLPEKPSSETLP